jgi:hypothetical protein
LDPFKEKQRLQQHQLVAHDAFMPTTCPIYQCSHDESFRTFQALQAHVVNNHTGPLQEAYRANKGQPVLECLYPGCHEKVEKDEVHTPGADHNKYRQHLQRAHDLWKPHERILYTMNAHVNANAWIKPYMPSIVEFDASRTSSTVAPPSSNAAASSTAGRNRCVIVKDKCADYGKDFKELSRLKCRIVLKHDQCYPAACPFEGCDAGGFEQYDSLNLYVKNDHISEIEKAGQQSSSKSQRCLFPGCTHPGHGMTVNVYK